VPSARERATRSQDAAGEAQPSVQVADGRGHRAEEQRRQGQADGRDVSATKIAI
jgi:hypothetical protein